MSKASAQSYWDKANEQPETLQYETVGEYSCTTDYTKKTGLNIGKAKAEFILNPLELWGDAANYDEGIAAAYNALYDNKLSDIIHLLGLSVALGENKKNNLLLTACSNKGKSELFELIGCVNIQAKVFFDALEAKSTGLAQSEVESIHKTALIVLDEVDMGIPAVFKQTTNEVKIRTMYKGQITIPVSFIAMTSTTASSIANVDEQITKRLLHVDIKNQDTIYDIGYEIDDYFKEQTQRYIRHLFLEGMKMDRAELERLKELFAIKATVNMYDENREDALKAIYNEFALTVDEEHTTSTRKIPFKKMALKHFTKVEMNKTNATEEVTNLMKHIFTGDRNREGRPKIFTNWEEQFGLTAEPTGMVFNEEAAMKEINHD